MKKIRCLITAITDTPLHEAMTKECYNSFKSKNHMLDISIDTKKYRNKLAGSWNVFFDYWRGRDDYDYLLWASNDCLLHKNFIDYVVKYLEDDAIESIGVVSAVQTTDKFNFSISEVKYTQTLATNMFTTAFVIKKGVIEKVGRIDELFPLEFLERDYFYRCQLAGIKCVSLDMPLLYHPAESMTIGNSTERLMKARELYLNKWNGDALNEKWTCPYGDVTLDYTFCAI